MKLNHECVRALLLTIEEVVPLDSNHTCDSLARYYRLKDFTIDDIIYTAKKLEEANFIKIRTFESTTPKRPIKLNLEYIDSLTYEGHQLLDNIRDPNVWQETKKSLSNVAGVSLSIISEVAASYLKERFGLS